MSRCQAERQRAVTAAARTELAQSRETTPTKAMTAHHADGQEKQQQAHRQTDTQTHRHTDTQTH